MRRRALAIWGVCVLVLAGICVSAHSAEKPSLEFREKFLREFRHVILDTTADDAMLLRILVEASGAKRGVEVGTARAFGAMNMGIGFERTGGHLRTIDISESMVKKARANLKTLGLDKTVTVIEGDALKVLPKIEGEIDFLFLDALKGDYFRYFQAVEDNLTDGSVIAADNTIGSARAMPKFLARLAGPGYDAVTVRASMKKNDGVTVAYKIPAAKRSPGRVSLESREKLLADLRQAEPKATAIDSILLRILVEASGAKRGVEIGAAGGCATIDMGIAFERTGGRLWTFETDAKKAAKARGIIKIAGLDKTVTVDKRNPLAVLSVVEEAHPGYDFLFLDGAGKEYFKHFRAVEGRLQAGAIIVADNTIKSAADVRELLDYLAKSGKYEVVTLRAEDRTNKDGMTVAYKVK